MTEFSDDLLEEPAHVADMTPVAMGPNGPVALTQQDVLTPPPEDPDQIIQDAEEPSIYWVMEDGLEVGYFRIVEQGAFECYVDAGHNVWRQIGIRTSEGDAVDLILDPPV